MHKGDVELERQGWSTRLTAGRDLRKMNDIGQERGITGERQDLCRMNRRDHMDTGRGAHPGTDARPVRSGIVVRGVVQLMCDRTASRDRQEGYDGKDDNPDEAMKAGTSHRKEPQPGAHASKLAEEASTQLFASRHRWDYGPPTPMMRSTRSSRPPRSRYRRYCARARPMSFLWSS